MTPQTPHLAALRPESKLRQMIEQQLVLWPDHRKFLEKSFSDRSAAVIENNYLIADLVHKLTSSDSDQFAQAYRWLCETFNEEEIHFRRTGQYRCSSLEEAKAAVYDNPVVMKSYIQGLLVSQLFWANHANVFHYYHSEFLRGNPDKYRHLEIGPGHGLLLCLAALDPRCAGLTGWDISSTSLALTRESLKKLGIQREVHLETRDALSANTEGPRFDSIVISEVLEHMETPALMLRALKKLLSPQGRLFINVPVNSPAPDHIYLWRSPEDVARFVTEGGFKVLDSRNFPMTGYTEAAARKHELTISCCLIVG